jgi:hypothetical protein
MALLTNNHIKLDNFSISNTSNSFPGVVTGNGRLQEKSAIMYLSIKDLIKK